MRKARSWQLPLLEEHAHFRNVLVASGMSSAKRENVVALRSELQKHCYLVQKRAELTKAHTTYFPLGVLVCMTNK